MIDAPIALAFTAGMVATVNPCGFAMLPAYLSFFLGSDESSSPSRVEAVSKALAVGAVVSAGFLVVFGVAGALVTWASLSVAKYSQWATIFIGLALIVLGIAMLRGFEPSVRLPKLNRGGRDQSLRSMFLFGMSYAITSISCTLPVFTSAVSGVFRRSNFPSGVTVFIAYSAGMAVVLLALTVSLGLAKSTLVGFLRRSLRFINKISGALLVVAGAYVAYYSWIEIRVTQFGDRVDDAGPVDLVTGWSNSATAWIQDTGPTRLGLILALVVGAAGVAVALARRTSTR